MTTLSLVGSARPRDGFRAPPSRHAARNADPIPSEHLTWTADLTIRAALALMPFPALAWMFVAR